MATIKYNNLNNPSNLVTFSDVSNILSVEDTTGGTKATFRFIVNDGWYSATTANTQWSITFMGDSVTNVLDPSNAINKNFYIAPDRHSTAASLCNALRACPTITAMFNVYLSTNESLNGHIVYLTAKEIGKAWNDITDDLQLSPASLQTYLGYAGTNGSASTVMHNALINVDIYNNDDYITSLQKTYYDGCYFDVTPVLATMSEIGSVKPYSMYVSYTNDSGITTSISSVTGNYTTVGYMTKYNFGEKYLTLTTGITIAQNVQRGSTKSSYNNTILYVYNNTIPLSFYTSTTGNTTYTVTYKDSAYNTISTTSGTVSVTEKLTTLEANLSYPNDCFYVDITIGDKTLRYDVIKPLKTSYGCYRIKFINSYGGTSFVDMVGEKQAQNESEIQTYNKNLLDFYTTQVLEKERVYDTEIKTTYTVKSHLIGEDGKWTFYDLLQSPYAWTEINGKAYAIIIENVAETEINNQGVFEITVKFHLSI